MIGTSITARCNPKVDSLPTVSVINAITAAPVNGDSPAMMTNGASRATTSAVMTPILTPPATTAMMPMSAPIDAYVAEGCFVMTNSTIEGNTMMPTNARAIPTRRANFVIIQAVTAAVDESSSCSGLGSPSPLRSRIEDRTVTAAMATATTSIVFRNDVPYEVIASDNAC